MENTLLGESNERELVLLVLQLKIFGCRQTKRIISNIAPAARCPRFWKSEPVAAADRAFDLHAKKATFEHFKALLVLCREVIVASAVVPQKEGYQSIIVSYKQRSIYKYRLSSASDRQSHMHLTIFNRFIKGVTTLHYLSDFCIS